MLCSEKDKEIGDKDATTPPPAWDGKIVYDGVRSCDTVFIAASLSSTLASAKRRLVVLVSYKKNTLEDSNSYSTNYGSSSNMISLGNTGFSSTSKYY